MPILVIVIAGVILAAAIFIYIYAFRFEPVNFKLSEVDICIRSDEKINNTSEENGSRKLALTILHLSDFHLRKNIKGRKLFKFIQTLNNLKTDFIFFTGDMVEKNENIKYLSDMLSGLQSVYGKYAVLGVHDYFNKTPAEFLRNMIKKKKEYKRQNDVEWLVSELKSIGIKVLRNENAAVYPDGRDFLRKVEIVGLEDPIIRKTDINKAFRGLEEKNNFEKNKEVESAADDFLKKRNKNQYNEVFVPDERNIHILNKSGIIRICLTHTPDYDLLVDLSKKNADLVMCGHTHGGQVRLPGIGALISGCNIKTRHTSGLFYFKKFVLFITKGLGEGRYSPFRFYCQPEANLIRIFLC
ncbi:MAG: metallophosphoesterase [Actinobacteria bacterium]|nr:metallophosphoesterase [Actinomycetota bacterium]